MKSKFKKFLEGNKFYPLSDSSWNTFELYHGYQEYKRRNYLKIKKNVGGKKGIYVYEKDGVILYVGKGNPVYSRIKSHYRASFEKVPGDTHNTWHAFFSKHCGKVKIYWKELEDERVRRIIEQMLTYVLEPSFEYFRKEYESKNIRENKSLKI
jgi:hypothetical protein